MKAATPYRSPLRQEQQELTRLRILDAVGSVLQHETIEELSFASVARQAGTAERTVYRHFPTRADLLDAFWRHMGELTELGTYPTSAEELIAAPRRVFPGFDRQAALITAALSSTSGREMRLRADPERRAAFLRCLEPLTQGRGERERWQIAAVSHALFSASTWQLLREHWQLSGAEAGAVVSWALRELISSLDRSALVSHPQAHETLERSSPMSLASLSHSLPSPDLAASLGTTVDLLGTHMTLKGAPQASGDSALFEMSCPPGSDVPLHSHPESESFYVLEGQLELTRHDGEETSTVIGAAGAAFTVQREQVHSLRNPGPGLLRAIVVCEPGLASFFLGAGRVVPTEAPFATTPPAAEEIERVLDLARSLGHHFHGLPPA